MARGGLSRHFLFVTVVLLLAGVGLWVTCRRDRGASSAASPVTAPAVPSASSAAERGERARIDGPIRE